MTMAEMPGHMQAYGTRIEQSLQREIVLSKSDPFFYNHCCNVLGNQNVYPSTETCISRTLSLFYALLFSINHIIDASLDLR